MAATNQILFFYPAKDCMNAKKNRFDKVRADGFYFLACVFVCFKTMTKIKRRVVSFSKRFFFSDFFLSYACVESVNKKGSVDAVIQKISKVCSAY